MKNTDDPLDALQDLEYFRIHGSLVPDHPHDGSLRSLRDVVAEAERLDAGQDERELGLRRMRLHDDDHEVSLRRSFTGWG